MINEEQLKETLKSFNKNLQALKDAINYHEHTKDGKAANPSAVKEDDGEDVYEEVSRFDIGGIFEDDAK